MKLYILLKPNEDGNPAKFIEEKELKDIKQFMEDYSITKFKESLGEEKEPQYWEEGEAMLLKVQIKKIKPVQIVEKYEME